MDTLFEEILKKLSEIHKQFPDLRFGQAVQSAIDLHKKGPNLDLHNYSSKVILEALKRFESETNEKRKVI